MSAEPPIVLPSRVSITDYPVKLPESICSKGEMIRSDIRSLKEEVYKFLSKKMLYARMQSQFGFDRYGGEIRKIEIKSAHDVFFDEHSNRFSVEVQWCRLDGKGHMTDDALASSLWTSQLIDAELGVRAE